MKIILSRKGFDSTSGGVPSPIFEDDTMVSLPIPYKSGVSYADIRTGLSEFDRVGKLVEELTKGKIKASSQAHLDPDLNALSISRVAGWRGTFGQSSSQQVHLDNNYVESGDLFLFFGLFRRVERTAPGKLQFVKGEPRKHVIFGWLSVDQKYELPNKSNQKASSPELPAWATCHAHVEHSDIEPKPNALYTAARKLDCDSNCPGWGLFSKYKNELCLSHPNPPKDERGRPKDLPSLWQLPAWMYPWIEPNKERGPLSYHKKRTRWTKFDHSHVTLQSVGRGQEFVLNSDQYPEAQAWAVNLIKDCGI
jgi:Nucleotide modification associated domain 3